VAALVAVLVDDRRQSSVAWIAVAACLGLLGGFVELDGFVVWAVAQAGFVVMVWAVELDGFVVRGGFVVLWQVDWCLAAVALGGYHSAAWLAVWLVVQA
jgi:hypothetical protein